MGLSGDLEREVRPFEVKTSRRDSRWFVAVRGEIDLATVGRLEAELNKLASPIVLDLGEVTFIDSMGLTLLLRATRDGLVIGRITPAVARVIAQSGLEDELLRAA